MNVSIMPLLKYELGGNGITIVHAPVFTTVDGHRNEYVAHEVKVYPIFVKSLELEEIIVAIQSLKLTHVLDILVYDTSWLASTDRSKIAIKIRGTNVNECYTNIKNDFPNTCQAKDQIRVLENKIVRLKMGLESIKFSVSYKPKMCSLLNTIETLNVVHKTCAELIEEIENNGKA